MQRTRAATSDAAGDEASQTAAARRSPPWWASIAALPLLVLCCTTTSAPVTAQGVCTQIQEAYSGCGGAWSSCAVTQPASCLALLAAYSNSYVSAITSCFGSGPPGDCTGACLHPAINGLSPSAAQTKLKEDFCAVCPDGASTSVPKSCSDFFINDGELLVIFDDAVADSIDRACLARTDAGGGDCSIAFSTCANAMTSQASQASVLGCGATARDGG